MKTYTFKIKSYDVVENVSPVIISLNCPLEVMYNSVKACKELSDFNGYITQTDYFDICMNEDGSINSTWVDNDVFVGDVPAIFKSDDLKDFLIHNIYTNETIIDKFSESEVTENEIQESV